MTSKFVCKEKKGTFVAFHFYFLLDLFQTALSFDRRSFFILGHLRNKISFFLAQIPQRLQELILELKVI